jgi:hypothetical protein
MTKLKNPPRDVAPIRLKLAPRAIVSSSAPAALTCAEVSLLASFRKMTLFHQEITVQMAAVTVEICCTPNPRRAAPTLKLVPGAAS